jgi:hypothetical protein
MHRNPPKMQKNVCNIWRAWMALQLHGNGIRPRKRRPYVFSFSSAEFNIFQKRQKKMLILRPAATEAYINDASIKSGMKQHHHKNSGLPHSFFQLLIKRINEKNGKFTTRHFPILFMLVI